MDCSLLNELNENQRAAVEYCDGAQLVIAGAGSGKTRVLTYKIAYLIAQKGIKPWNILALTFTNKAAREMKQRIETIVGPQARYIHSGTFHSVFAHILRKEATHIGYNSNFTIYDQTDSRSLVKAIIKEMNLDDKVYKPAAVADRISMAKNHLLTAAKYANSQSAVTTDIQHKMPAVKDIYARYSERCRQANAMDFDDLLMNIHILFANNEDIRRKYAERFEYVLVDEYQDTNSAQQAIVNQLTRDRQMVCVVGDDAQSIYSFRGANIDNILGFQQTYNNARLFKLEQNYRSTQTIVNAANSLIRHNQRQIPKTVFSENEQGEKIRLTMAYSDKEEAMIVCNEISRLRRIERSPYSDFAILYRTNSQSRSFEEYMRKQNIPYRIYGGLSFYQRKEIKDIIAYFRVVANPDDEEAIKRIINYPARGIGNTTLSKIVETANEKGTSIWRVLNNSEACGLSVSKATHTKLHSFCSLIDGWIQRSATDDAYMLGRDIIQESG
ncbi:MAG: ATP-dependent helicase, partial [Prevotella sp.]